MMEDFSFSPERFSGMARLFPLPTLVLFPHVMQPLRVFEPRYRNLLEESLVDDRLITMAVLSPGWEKDYEGRPPISPMACLGRVAAYHCLKDGAYNILLVGLCRVRLIRELPFRKTFREAEGLLLDDCYPANDPSVTRDLHRRLRKAFLQILPDLPHAQEQLGQLLSTKLSLGALTDVIGYLLDVCPRTKVTLLSELNVHRRAELLLDHLAAFQTDTYPSITPKSGFPPEFSLN